MPAAQIDRRDTKQKSAIRETFVASDRPLSPEEVLHAARIHVANIGIATVYRSIKALVAVGWLEIVDIPGEPSRYEISGKGHHHHFHCEQCGRIFELGDCSEFPGVKVPPKFKVTSHHLTVRGFCAACRSKSATAAPRKPKREV